MSELKENDKIKQEKLKAIIKKLHDGTDFNKIKKEFSQIIKNVSLEEISNMRMLCSEKKCLQRKFGGYVIPMCMEVYCIFILSFFILYIKTALVMPSCSAVFV